MTDTDEPQHRTYHQPDPGDVELREPDQNEEGVFEIRMPVVTTGEVRNEGDDPFDREALEGMAEQYNSGQIPVFLDHGANPDLGGRYSATEKAGVWRDAEVETREADGEDQVVASAVLMDPDTLPAETGTLREMLSRVKSQIERGIPQSTSIGWQDDEDAPGGHDVWETSIVGIPADPRTTDDDVAVAAARDVLADADLDAEERERLVEEFRAAVMGPDAEGGNARDSVTDDNDNEPGGDADRDNTDDEQDEFDEREYRESMLEMQRQQTETLSALAESLRESDDEDDEEEEENEGDNDDEEEDEEDDDGGEQSADTDERTVEIDGEERSVSDLVEERQTALEELRANGPGS